MPEHIHGDDLNKVLWEQRQDLIAYAISFAVIGRFWVVHHRFFSSVVGFDGRLLGLNLFYLGWIALFPFSAQVFGDHAGDAAAIILYALNLVALLDPHIAPFLWRLVLFFDSVGRRVRRQRGVQQ